MAFLREFEYIERDDTLIEYFFLETTDKFPALVIRLNTKTLETHLYRKRFVVNRVHIIEELKRLYMLLEDLHWKSYVRLSHPHHRVRNYELF